MVKITVTFNDKNNGNKIAKRTLYLTNINDSELIDASILYEDYTKTKETKYEVKSK